MNYRLVEWGILCFFFCERGEWRGYNFPLILVFMKIFMKILKSSHKLLFVDLIGHQIVLKVIHTIHASQIPYFPHPRSKLQRVLGKPRRRALYKDVEIDEF